MKKKDIIYLLLAVVILLVAGYVAFTQLVPQKAGSSSASSSTTVEVVGAIAPDFDQTALSQLDDTSKVRDFSVPIDLKTGLNNTAIFGP